MLYHGFLCNGIATDSRIGRRFWTTQFGRRLRCAHAPAVRTSSTPCWRSALVGRIHQRRTLSADSSAPLDPSAASPRWFRGGTCSEFGSEQHWRWTSTRTLL